MKRLLLALVVFAPFFLSSCQCSNKPDIGPVEDESHAGTTPSSEFA